MKIINGVLSFLQNHCKKSANEDTDVSLNARINVRSGKGGGGGGVRAYGGHLTRFLGPWAGRLTILALPGGGGCGHTAGI